MMKKRFSKLNFASFVGLAVSLLAGLSLFNKNNSVEPVSAAINYSACETAHSSGDASALKTALYNVVKDGNPGSYSSLWTNYWTVYKRDDGYLKDYYSSVSNFTVKNQDNGSGGTTEGDKYNREHAIPKNWWGGDTTNQGADIFIVVPADKKVNNTRSDHCFGMVGSASYTSSGGYSKQGTSADGWNFFGSPVFEPNDDVKGDLARIYFYAVIKYNVSSWRTGNGSYVFSGNTSASSNFGLTANAVKLLSYWNNLDKPDAWERKVNTRGNSVQGNPNPFIDHPEYANTLWGDVSGYTTYSESGASISVTPSSGSVAVGATLNLTATTSGGTGSVTWTSSNTNVATVDSSGVVTGVAAGSATITGTYSGETDTCAVTVTASGGGGGGGGSSTVTDTMIAKGFGGYTTNSYSAASTDYTGKANLTNNSDATYAMQVFNGSTGQVRGNQSGSANFSCRNTTTYEDYYVSEVSLTVNSDGTLDGSDSNRSVVWFGTSAYANPSTAPSAGTKVTASPASSGQSTLTWTNSNTSYNYFILYNLKAASSPKSESDSTPLTVTWTPVPAQAKTLSSIAVSTSNHRTFSQGDTFVKETITATYSDSSTADVTSSAIFSGYNMSTTGNQTVSVSYTEGGINKTASYSITVSAPSPTLTIGPTDIDGYTGQVISVTAIYSNLESDLSWGAVGTGSITGGSITWSSSDHRNGSSTYSCTLSGEGDKTITADATGVEAAQCLITITKTAFTTTPSSTASVAATQTATLTAALNSGGQINWLSDDTNVATVTASGTSVTVTGVAQGTATITARSEDDSTVYAECEVTVTAAPLEYEIIFGTTEGTSGITDFSNTSYVIPSGVTLNNIQGNVYSNTSNQAASLRFGKSGTTGSFDASITGDYYITSVKCNLKYYGSDTTATFAVTPSGGSAISKSLTDSWADYTFDVSTAKAKKVTLGTDVSGKRAYLSGFTIYYAASKTLSSISLSGTYPTTFAVGDTFSHAGMVVTAHYSDSSTADVTSSASWSSPDLSSTGNKTVTVSYTDGLTKTANYTITVNSNPSISWVDPTIQEYTGTSLSGTNVNDWAVTYNDGAGHFTVLTYNQLTIKLGQETISIPHIWAASENGKALSVTYSGLTLTATNPIDLIQSVNNIYADNYISNKSDLTFEAACGGTGTADDGKGWTITSDASESNFDGDSGSGRGIHYGTNNTTTGLVTYISLTSSDFTVGRITKVEVNAAAASAATVQVNIGGSAFGGAPKSLDSSAHPSDPYTFTGNVAADEIEVLITKPAAAAKALYCRSIVVTYETASGTTQIANNTSHKAAQKAAVKFAKAFNTAMDTTGYCTTNLSSAWSTCSSAYTTFLSEAAALGTTEETYAKNLIKYATAQYSDDSGEACIERMRKTYEICVSKHGQTAFMSDLVTVSPSNDVVLFSNITSNKKVIVIVIVSLISVTTIGGYFFIRRRKPE